MVIRRNQVSANVRPAAPDDILVEIADYVCHPPEFSALAYKTARYSLLDSLGCGLLALNYPDCARMLGPVVEGADMTNGVRVPGTSYRLDPVQAAFNIGTMIRWLDYNDTWLAAEWGHPSDNLGAILSVAGWIGGDTNNATSASGNDSSTRDSRHSRARKQFQQGWSRSCIAGTSGQYSSGYPNARRDERSSC